MAWPYMRRWNYNTTVSSRLKIGWDPTVAIANNHSLGPYRIWILLAIFQIASVTSSACKTCKFARLKIESPNKYSKGSVKQQTYRNNPWQYWLINSTTSIELGKQLTRFSVTWFAFRAHSIDRFVSLDLHLWYTTNNKLGTCETIDLMSTCQLISVIWLIFTLCT